MLIQSTISTQMSPQIKVAVLEELPAQELPVEESLVEKVVVEESFVEELPV